MIQITAEVEGMMCGMCESHVADAIRKQFPKAKKVSASVSKGSVSFRLDEDYPQAILKHEIHQAIDPTGYTVGDVTKEEVKKKGLFW